MIEVKLTLYTPRELAIIHDALTFITAERKAVDDPFKAATGKMIFHTPPMPATPEIEEALAAIKPEPLEPELHGTGEMAEEQEPEYPTVSVEDLQAAAQEHLNKFGAPATRELMVKITGQGRIGQIPEAQRGEVYAAMKAEVMK